MAEELVGFFAVFAFFMLLYSHLALDDFVARTVLTGDRATAPLGHGSVKWRVPSALQIHLHARQGAADVGFTNYGCLLETF